MTLRIRYWRILAFFARVTLSFIVFELIAPRLGLGSLTRSRRLERNRRAAARFRKLAIRLGGLMIKTGQVLSTRLDILPPEITKELADLQDAVPPVEFALLRASAEAELGGTLESKFAWFDPTALAAASLGQVHRARLHEEDAQQLGFEDVVVKVQRPAIEEIVEVDLAALRRVGTWLQRYQPVSRRADVIAIVEEFSKTTREEIDYLAEASNAEVFREHFADTPHVRIPSVVWPLTNRRVLTLEDVAAIKIGDYDAITAAGIDRGEVATVLLETYIKQILDDGFFHADPHPGNLFVTPLEQFDEQGRRDWQLTFIDFGMVGRVPENLREGIRESFIAIATQDAPRLIQSFKTLNVLLPNADLARIESASAQLFDRFGDMTIGDLQRIDPKELVNFGLQFQELLRELPFQLPEDLLLLGRTVAILSGMCAGLDPNFNVWAAITPYAAELVDDGDGGRLRFFFDEASKLLQLAISLPGKADRVLTQIERGQVVVQTPRLDLRVRGVERAIQRQTWAILDVGLLVAAALLRESDRGLSNALFIAAAVVGIRVLFAGIGRPPGF